MICEVFMRYYSNFWLSGSDLGPAWAERSDLPEPSGLDARAEPLEDLAMVDGLALPEAVQQTVIAVYMGANRGRRRAWPSRKQQALHRVVSAHNRSLALSFLLQHHLRHSKTIARAGNKIHQHIRHENVTYT
jgi:hypothetical protein